MSCSAHRILPIFLIPVALLALAACGATKNVICATPDCCGTLPCLAPRYLYAAGTNGQVVSFPVESTGALGTSTSTPGPSPTLGMAALNNQFLYVSNPVPELSGAVSAWTISPTTGALTTVPGSPFSLGAFSVAAGLATNGAAQVVYVADAGRIDALKADSSGALTPLSGSAFSAGTNLYLAIDPSSQFLFASDDTPPGNVLAFTMDSTGALTPVAGSPFPTVPGFVGNTTPFQIVVDSSGSFVYTVLNATNQVAAFSIVKPSGALTPVPGSPFAAGSSPIVVTTARNFLYVGNALDRTVSGYRIDATTGVLTPLSGFPFAIAGGAFATDPTGTFFYASGSAGIFAYGINPQTGALTPIAGSPFPAPAATVLAFVQ